MDTISRHDIFNITIDEEAKAQLLDTARWTKFIAIIGFIFLAMLILFAVFASAGLTMASELNNWGGALGTGLIITYLIVALLYFFPIYYLYKYSVIIKPAIVSGDQTKFNLALSYQRRMFKFIGILFLIIIGIYALLLIFGILGAAITGF